MANLNLLHPKIKDEVKTLVGEINSKILTGKVKMIVTQTLRTFEEQNALFNKKPKVTNAKGGQSMHNYGLAFDFALSDGKVAIWDTAKDFDGDKNSDWLEVVKTFKNAGYVWGGDFRSISDKPHFEKTFGHTWQQLLALHSAGKVDKDGYVIV